MERRMTPQDVQHLRRRLGWTQRQLAAALNVTETTVARWEQGARAVTPLAATSLTLLARQHGAALRRRPRKAS
jgi:DNA-binding transcriptional regulator YiaG